MIELFKMKNTKRTVLLTTIALLLISLFSIFVISDIVSDPGFYAETLKSLDEKQDTVLKLAAAAAASSTALSLIPGDAAMPIADQIAQLTTYFIAILGAILLEKMLITAVGYVSFTFIIPAACLLGILYLFIKDTALRNLAIKLAIFGVVIFIAIPASVQVSDLIYDSYEKGSIEEALNTAEDNKDYIEKNKAELSEQDLNLIEKAGAYISRLTSRIGDSLTAMVSKGEETLNGFLEAIAVLIITSCVIPIVVILIFIWSIKIIFGFKGNGLTAILRDKSIKRQIE